MAKKEKIIKRVYEQGWETTLSSRRRSVKAKKAARARASLARKRPPPVKTSSPRQLTERQLKSFSDVQQLPQGYGITQVTLLVKDPLWLYAYWEIAPVAWESLSRKIGKERLDSAKVVLRMYEVSLINFNGSNANSYFDIEVAQANSWYINLWTDNGCYIGEIGLRTAAGQFFALVRSNAAQTPRVSYSPRSEQVWMEVRQVEAGPQPLRPRIKALPVNGSAQAPARTRDWKTIYLTPEDIRAYYAKVGTFLHDILAARLNRKTLVQFKFVLEGETIQERKRILSWLPENYFIKSIIAGASETLVTAGGAQSGGASDFVAEKVKPRSFYFELGTELIVYGRTEPSAQVWLGEKQISLNKDGTFSLRFALPDGKLPLEFKATSSDKKETRQITTSVERNTAYGKTKGGPDA